MEVIISFEMLGRVIYVNVKMFNRSPEIMFSPIFVGIQNNHAMCPLHATGRL